MRTRGVCRYRRRSAVTLRLEIRVDVAGTRHCAELVVARRRQLSHPLRRGAHRHVRGAVLRRATAGPRLVDLRSIEADRVLPAPPRSPARGAAVQALRRARACARVADESPIAPKRGRAAWFDLGYRSHRASATGPAPAPRSRWAAGPASAAHADRSRP